MEVSFAGKRALVTGAGKGIGCSLVKALVNGGATTFALSRTESDLATLKEECPQVHTLCVDLSNWAHTKDALSQIGDIDLLVNNAAVALLGSFFDITPHDFDTSFNVNVKQVINVSQVIAKNMIDRGVGGSIVNVSSQASMAALKDHTVYCGTKGALDAITRVMALELGQHKIRVNTVNPTVVMTAMGRIGWSDPVKAESMLSKIPLRRFAEVDDVVSTILFLLSDKAAMISGVSLPIDGGFTAC